MLSIMNIFLIYDLHWNKNKDWNDLSLFQWKNSLYVLQSSNWKATYDESYDSNLNMSKSSF